MRRELKKRHVKKLKVVYSKEKPIRPIDDLSISCRTHYICPPGTKPKCTIRRDIPGSNAFGVLTNQYSILTIIHESSS